MQCIGRSPTIYERMYPIVDPVRMHPSIMPSRERCSTTHPTAGHTHTRRHADSYKTSVDRQTDRHACTHTALMHICIRWPGRLPAHKEAAIDKGATNTHGEGGEVHHGSRERERPTDGRTDKQKGWTCRTSVSASLPPIRSSPTHTTGKDIEGGSVCDYSLLANTAKLRRAGWNMRRSQPSFASCHEYTSVCIYVQSTRTDRSTAKHRLDIRHTNPPHPTPAAQGDSLSLSACLPAFDTPCFRHSDTVRPIAHMQVGCLLRWIDRMYVHIHTHHAPTTWMDAIPGSLI